MITKALEKLFDTLISLKMAVFIIVAIGIVSAVGTVYESKYDAHYAQTFIYHSLVMYFLLGLLCTTLICVMIDRWPWKRHHSAFVLAHIGIIILILGSVVTRYFGIDGTMYFPLGETRRYVDLPGSAIGVYVQSPEGRFSQYDYKIADFLKKPPSEEDRYTISLDGGKKIEFLKYFHYSERMTRVAESESRAAGPAIRVQFESSRINMADWVILSQAKPWESINLGPAQLVLTQDIFKYEGGNAIVFRPIENNMLEYMVFSDSKGGLAKKGKAAVGDVVQTGWMDIKVRILRFMPKAEKVVWFEEKQYPNKITVPAVQFQFDGEKYWMQKNSTVKLFTNQASYVVSFENIRYDVGFPMKLKEFRIGHYQGTQNPMSYESDVVVNGQVHNISMNEPFKHNGFTFYQSSFEKDEEGKPAASILSVNKDPGRWIKYLGSFLIVFGAILLMYFKKTLAKPRKARKAAV